MKRAKEKQQNELSIKIRKASEQLEKRKILQVQENIRRGYYERNNDERKNKSLSQKSKKTSRKTKSATEISSKHFTWDDISRLYVSRKEGGREIASIEMLQYKDPKNTLKREKKN